MFKNFFMSLTALLFINPFIALPCFAETKPVVLNKFLQFVLKAKSGTVKKLDAKDAKQTRYQLDLQDVDNSVLYFTNRPRRIVDNIPVGFFLKRWVKPPPHDFTAAPPNAAIIYANAASGLQDTVIVMLTKPIYDSKTHTLQFIIQPTSGGKLTLPLRLLEPVITMSEVTVCGVLGAWGDLPGEPQSDVACHAKAGD